MSRVRAVCPISYRQNALKMPRASRAVIIEETRAGKDEAKLRRGKLRAALGLRDEDDDAMLGCHMRPRRCSYILGKLLRTDICNIVALLGVLKLYEKYAAFVARIFLP